MVQTFQCWLSTPASVTRNWNPMNDAIVSQSYNSLGTIASCTGFQLLVTSAGVDNQYKKCSSVTGSDA